MNERHSTPIPVILDVDTGVDDALALTLAARHPALDLRAVTCTAGNVSLDHVVRNTLGVLALAGASGVPVAGGMDRPLLEPARNASYVHGENGIADLRLPTHELTPEPVHAVELLRRTLLDAPGPVTIIALAPLTNIAALLRMYPEVVRKIARITLMGGAIGQGNATAAAEFNVWHDPEAAQIVFDAPVPVTMYGLEPFYEVTCDHADAARLSDSPEPLNQFIGGLLTHLAGTTATTDRATPGTVALGDAGAVCAVLDPAGAQVRPAPVSVCLAPGVTRGQTVVDLRGFAGTDDAAARDARPRIDVVTNADGARYRELFLSVLP